MDLGLPLLLGFDFDVQLLLELVEHCVGRVLRQVRFQAIENVAELALGGSQHYAGLPVQLSAPQHIVQLVLEGRLPPQESLVRLFVVRRLRFLYQLARRLEHLLGRAAACHRRASAP